MAKIFIPSIGVAMQEALLVKWLKQPGEVVAAEEAVAEIETDKAAMDLTSPVSGKLGSAPVRARRNHPRGNHNRRGCGGRRGERTRAQPAEAPVARHRAGGLADGSSPPGFGRQWPSATHAQPAGASMARERGAEAPPQVEAPPQLDRFRALIAAKVADSWREIPHFTVTREVDAEPMLATLDLLRRGAFEPKPTLTDTLLRALALGLRECRLPRP